MKEKFMLLTILFFMSHASAKDFGVHGPLFPIQEKNLLEIIQKKLNLMERSGKVVQLNNHLQKKMTYSAENPVVVNRLPRALKSRSRLFDPSISMAEDIKDHNGNVVVKAGTWVNPLDYLSWGESIFLLDGTDEEQISWAQKNKGKWVLIKGNPFKVGKESNRWVYFDQGGTIVRKFNIQHLPARISQKGKHLLVEEIAINDESVLPNIPKMIFLKEREFHRKPGEKL